MNTSTGLYEYATVKESAEAGIAARFITRLQALGYENISNAGDTLLQANGYTSHKLVIYPLAIRYTLRVTVRSNRYRLILTGFDLSADGSSGRLETMGNRFVRVVNKKLPDILNPLLAEPNAEDKW